MTTGQAVRLVARREFVERGRDKSFLISTIFTLVILLGVAIVPTLFGRDDDTRTVAVATDVPDRDAMRPALEQQGRLAGITIKVVDADPADVRERVESDDVDVALVGDGTVVVREELDGSLGAAVQQAHRVVRSTERLREAGIDPATVERAGTVPALRVDAIDPPDERAEERERVAFVGTIVLYGQLIGYGFWIALGVVEEKSGRVVELLLSTISARALLAGKVLGVGLLGLVQLLFLSAVTLAAAAAVDAIDVTSDTLGVVGILLLWFVLGYFFYSTVFAAAAARVSRQEDLQNVTTPATMLVLISFFAAIWAGNNPDSLLARALAVLPPFSALVNPVRMAVGDAPAWELVLAAVLMLAATAGLVLVGARLYEGAVLRTGGKVRLAEAWRSRAGG